MSWRFLLTEAGRHGSIDSKAFISETLRESHMISIRPWKREGQHLPRGKPLSPSRSAVAI
jgi:hypothetical protein